MNGRYSFVVSDDYEAAFVKLNTSRLQFANHFEKANDIPVSLDVSVVELRFGM